MPLRIHGPAGLTPWGQSVWRKKTAQECLSLAVKAMNEGRELKTVPVLVCDAKTRAGRPCPLGCSPGETRCKFHGGRSTGPKTAEGKAACAAGRRRKETTDAPQE